MCTAISFLNHYFGRNLDLEYSYDETVTITPRRFPFSFHNGFETNRHAAMIGMAYVVDGYPLYYDATNEYGLSMAGLHFPGNAYYGEEPSGIAPYELIPFVLSQCKNTVQAVELLRTIQISQFSFRDLPVTPLHWLLSDGVKSIVIEPLQEGLRTEINPVDVLTDNPPL
ncbi:MAG: linear amide C-N hydrolase, partial [Ruminococcaceae bacterium]|nr:linear amide C-N hydrolase [Oscillospiraceae bacterium]